MRDFVDNIIPANHPQRKRWQRFRDLPNVSAYIEHVSYRCFTPIKLLEHAQVDMKNIAIVIIDAEGEDASIVDSLSEIPGFKPGVLQFEGRWTHSHVATTVQRFRKLGFQAGHNTNEDEGTSNIFAIAK